MTRLLAPVVWLTFVWVVLWGELTVVNVVSGVVTSVLLLLLLPIARPHQPAAFRPLAVMRFFAFFGYKLVEASAIVAWEVITPQNRINEGIVAVPVTAASDLIVTVVANAITLTPGTLTLEIDREQRVLYVHVLHLRDLEAMRREVQRLEEFALKAFGSARAVAAFEAQHRPGEGEPR